MSIFKSFRKHTRVLRRKIVFKCVNCGDSQELNDSVFTQREDYPYNAQSSSSTYICNCGCRKFEIYPEYQWLYRKRCPTCGEMFENQYSWERKCKTCNEAHLDFMMNLGRH